MSDPLAIDPRAALSRTGDPQQRLRQAADQLEGLFLQTLLKDARAGQENSLLGESNAARTYEEMLHTALVERSAGGLGLSETIFRQLAVRAGIELERGDAS